MKITKFLTFATALGVLFTSCNKDELDGGYPSLPEAVGSGMLTVYVTDAVQTRSNPSAETGSEAGSYDESKITSLDILVYSSATTTPDTTIHQSGSDVEVLHHIGVSTGSKKVVVLTNRTVDFSSALSDMTYDALQASLYNEDLNTATKNPTELFAAGIPMAGEKDVVAVQESVVTAVVEIARLYARFNAPTANTTVVALSDSAKVELAELLNVEVSDIESAGIDFDLNGYVVINGLKKSYMLPNYGVAEEAARWDSSIWQLGNVLSNYTASDYDAQGGLGTVYSGDEFLVSTPVYVYENSPKYTSNYGFDASSVYAFIIEADLTVTMGSDVETLTRYWRINVSKTAEMDNLYKILRNAIYNVNIDTIKTIGYATAEDAENPEPPIPGLDDAILEVTVKVSDWRVFEEGQDI